MITYYPIYYHQYYYLSSTIYIYPLTESIPLCLPKVFDEQFIINYCHISNLPCYHHHHKDKIINKLPTIHSIRRAELLYQQFLSLSIHTTDYHLSSKNKNSKKDVNNNDSFYQSILNKHQSRQFIQISLYNYVLNHLLGLSTTNNTTTYTTTNNSNNSIPLLLDLGCGINQMDIINHYLLNISNFNQNFIPICIDLFNNNNNNTINSNDNNDNNNSNNISNNGNNNSNINNNDNNSSNNKSNINTNNSNNNNIINNINNSNNNVTNNYNNNRNNKINNNYNINNIHNSNNNNINNNTNNGNHNNYSNNNNNINNNSINNNNNNSNINNNNSNSNPTDNSNNNSSIFNYNIHLIKCNLMKHVNTNESQLLIPLPDYSIQYIISISFIQWLLINNHDHNQKSISNHYINQLMYEIIRLLNQSIGQCIIQFYPNQLIDIQLICEIIEKIQSNLCGCILISKPVFNRGMKIFLYLTYK
ncbi:unnamed protein product [Schistosoma rodhaini]|uniref:Methyltranfer_dom domain-containing protein n=1 Tax=Schistosoma rodhaini TaxID=6188 RepID=A0AA85GBQ0_9TREM|nr:unnamed protein product [Schistosoma rodhaini]